MSARTSALEYLFGLELVGVKFGLDNITALIDALGQPQRAFRSVHIAGTNGKGSVAAMLDAALRAAGHRAGRYTSPHLVDLSERFVVDGRPIEAGHLDALIEQVGGVANALVKSGRLEAPPTFFEVATAMAFEWFRQQHVAIAVCEVGLGGRLDATNVLEPMACAITSIGLDHQQFLGETVQEIAVEKAGIIKAGVPVVTGGMPGPAHDAIARVARQRGAPHIVAAEGTVIEPLASPDRLDAGAQPRLRLRTLARDDGDIELGLRGDHQIDNAVVAVRLLETIETTGLCVGVDAIREGLSRVTWPGRLELKRLPDGRELLLDAAHNPDGAAALARHLQASGTRRPLVFGAMRDKDLAAMLQTLAPVVERFVMTRARTPRAAGPDDLAAIARAAAPDVPAVIVPAPLDALAEAWRSSARITVAGSIFLLGDVIEALEGS